MGKLVVFALGLLVAGCAESPDPRVIRLEGHVRALEQQLEMADRRRSDDWLALDTRLVRVEAETPNIGFYRVTWESTVPWVSDVDIRVRPDGEGSVVHAHFRVRPRCRSSVRARVYAWEDRPDAIAPVIIRDHREATDEICDVRFSVPARFAYIDRVVFGP